MIELVNLKEEQPSKKFIYSKSSIINKYNEIHIVFSDGLLMDPLIDFIGILPKEKKIFLCTVEVPIHKKLLRLISAIEKTNFLTNTQFNSEDNKNIIIKNCSAKDFPQKFNQYHLSHSLKLYLVNPSSLSIDIDENKGDIISTDIDPYNLSILSLEETSNKNDYKELIISSSIPGQSDIKMKHGLTSFFLQNKTKIEYAIFEYFFSIISKQKISPVSQTKYISDTSQGPRKLISFKLTRYFMRLILLKIKARYLLLLETMFDIDSLSESWSVGYLNHETGEVLNLPNFYNYNLADPFIFEYEGTDYCFVEKFDFKSKGEIHVYDLNLNVYLGLALKENFHLSYPFVFSHNDKIYMLPETSESKDIRLYESKNFPLEWELSAILINHIRAVDSMLFYDDYESQWLLLTNTASSIVDGDFHSLTAFTSRSIAGPYEEIEGVNIFNDSTIGRNGGCFKDQGAYFRVSQYYGHNCYGKSAKIHRIKKMQMKTYLEDECMSEKIDFLQGCADKLTLGYKRIGFHHVNMNKNFAVFDFKIKPKLLKMISISQSKMPWI